MTVEGPFSGDPTRAAIAVGDKPAALVTGTPREWNAVPSGDTPTGAQTVVCDDGAAHYQGRVAVIALELRAERTNLMRGETTTFTARVIGLDGIPDESWNAPYASERLGRSMLDAAAPDFGDAGGRTGRLVLVLENKSSEIISIDGEKGGRIVLTIDRAAILNGVYEYKGKIRSKQRGAFNIHGTLIPLMAPVRLAPAAGR